MRGRRISTGCSKKGPYLVNSFVVTPVCSPSRASLMTSRYGSELKITDWIHPRKEADLGLEPGTPTWPQLLRDAGYRTALIGKWHLGTQDRFHPSVFGYADFFGFREGGAKVIHPLLEVEGEQRIVRGLTTDILTDEAIRWLRLHDPESAPFALSLHYRAPHAPWLPLRDEDWSDFESLDPNDSQSRLSQARRRPGQTGDARIPGQRGERRPQRGTVAGGTRPAGTGGEHNCHLHQRPRLQHGPQRHLAQRQRALGAHGESAGDRTHPGRAAAQHVRPFAPRPHRRSLAGCY